MGVAVAWVLNVFLFYFGFSNNNVQAECASAHACGSTGQLIGGESALLRWATRWRFRNFALRIRNVTRVGGETLVRVRFAGSVGFLGIAVIPLDGGFLLAEHWALPEIPESTTAVCL